MKQKMAELLQVIYGFRKFIVMLLVCVIAVLFRIYSYISGSELVDLLKATVLGFFGSNSVEHMSSVVKEYINSKGEKVSEHTDAPIIADEDEGEVRSPTGASNA